MSDKLRQYIREMILQELEELEENSTSAATPGYQSPNAFTPNAGDSKKDDLVRKTVAWCKDEPGLKEGKSRYAKYKAKHGTPKEKIGQAIRDIDKNLKNIHHLLEMNEKLKKEHNLESTDFWKRTVTQISRIEQSILHIARKIKELKA